MNILYHHRTQGTGAEGVHIAHVIKGCQDLGYFVNVVSPTGHDPAQTAGGNPFARKRGLRSRLLSALSRHLPQWMFELSELAYNLPAYAKLRRTVAHGPPPRFIYERYAFFLFAGARLARRRGIPYVVEVNEIAGQKRVRKQFFVNWARRIESFVFRRADAIVVVSEFLKDRIRDLGIDAAKIHVMPNAADVSQFDPARFSRSKLRRQYGLQADTTVVGFVGWFVAWHNLELLVKAFARCAKGTNAALVLVGDGTLRQDLERLARTEGVGGQIVFTGAVPHDQIPQHIHMMDVGVIPGSNDYRSPIKLFEYMAMAKAVVAPRLEPIEAVVRDGLDGLLFAGGDLESLTRVLGGLISDPGRRQRIGHYARQTVIGHHTWHKNAAEIVEIAERIAPASGDGTSPPPRLAIAGGGRRLRADLGHGRAALGARASGG